MIRLVCCMHHHSLNNNSKNDVNRRPQRPYKKTITEEHYNLNSLILIQSYVAIIVHYHACYQLTFTPDFKKLRIRFFYFDEEKRNS